MFAYADDLLAILQSHLAIEGVKLTFELFETISSLALGLSKCYIVPCSGIDFWLSRERIATFLERLGDWSSLQIVESSKYLGLMIGPKALSSQWVSAIDKWEARTRTITHASLSVREAINAYNIGSISVLQYIGSLVHPPSGIYECGRRQVQSLFRLPNYAFPRELLVFTCWLGMPLCMDVRTTLLNTLARTAKRLEQVWSELVTELREGSYHMECRPAGWDSEAIVCTLADSRGTPLDQRMVETSSLLERTRMVYPLDEPRIPKELSRKLEKWSGIHVDEQLIEARATSLRKASCATLNVVARTWANGWTTSRRTQQTNLPCSFGCCGCRDDLQHYVQCETLWNTVANAHLRFAHLASATVLRRLCLDPNCALTDDATALAVAHEVTKNADCQNVNTFARRSASRWVLAPD